MGWLNRKIVGLDPSEFSLGRFMDLIDFFSLSGVVGGAFISWSVADWVISWAATWAAA